MAEIDVGYYNASVNWNATGDNYTRINLGNPANESGVLTSVQFYAANITSLVVGVFFVVSGTTYRDRDSVSLGNFNGAQTVTGLSIDVNTSDIIGYYHNTGYLSGRSGVTGNPLRWISGNAFGADTDYTGNVTNYAFNLYATGETSAAGGGALVGGSTLVGGQILVGNSPLIN